MWRRHVCYVCKRSVCGGDEPQPVAHLSHKLQCARQSLKIMVFYGNKYPRHNARPHVVEQSGQCARALRVSRPKLGGEAWNCKQSPCMECKRHNGNSPVTRDNQIHNTHLDSTSFLDRVQFDVISHLAAVGFQDQYCRRIINFTFIYNKCLNTNNWCKFSFDTKYSLTIYIQLANYFTINRLQ